jgi:hypothetical protein
MVTEMTKPFIVSTFSPYESEEFFNYFADREMFAYNSYQERKQQQLAKITPEQRIKYCFEFLKGYIADGDDQMTAKCYAGIAKYSDLLDTSEAHY